MVSSTSSRDHSIVSIASGITRDVLRAAYSADSWDRLVMASVPLVASAVWYFSRTVIEVTDDEQALWIQMWLSQQSSALRRVRRLQLLSPSAKMSRRNMDPYGDRPSRADEEEDKDGGRFAPPKLDFQPVGGVLAWTWFGWWPVSVASASDVGSIDPYYGRPGGSGRAGYMLTVWFSPFGASTARQILLHGRQLWLAKRAKKTEIWLPRPNHSPVGFKIVTRPSRPLTSVIVESDTKEDLRQDAIHF